MSLGYYCGELNLTMPSGPCWEGYYCPPRSVQADQILCPEGAYCHNTSALPALCPQGERKSIMFYKLYNILTY